MRSQEARIKPRLSERLSRTGKEFWKQRQLQAMVWPCRLVLLEGAAAASPHALRRDGKRAEAVPLP